MFLCSGYQPGAREEQNTPQEAAEHIVTGSSELEGSPHPPPLHTWLPPLLLSVSCALTQSLAMLSAVFLFYTHINPATFY